MAKINEEGMYEEFVKYAEQQLTDTQSDFRQALEKKIAEAKRDFGQSFSTGKTKSGKNISLDSQLAMNQVDKMIQTYNSSASKMTDNVKQQYQSYIKNLIYNAYDIRQKNHERYENAANKSITENTPFKLDNNTETTDENEIRQAIADSKKRLKDYYTDISDQYLKMFNESLTNINDIATKGVQIDTAELIKAQKKLQAQYNKSEAVKINKSYNELAAKMRMGGLKTIKDVQKFTDLMGKVGVSGYDNKSSQVAIKKGEAQLKRQGDTLLKNLESQQKTIFTTNAATTNSFQATDKVSGYMEKISAKAAKIIQDSTTVNSSKGEDLNGIVKNASGRIQTAIGNIKLGKDFLKNNNYTSAKEFNDKLAYYDLETIGTNGGTNFSATQLAMRKGGSSMEGYIKLTKQSADYLQELIQKVSNGTKKDVDLTADERRDLLSLTDYTADILNGMNVVKATHHDYSSSTRVSSLMDKITNGYQILTQTGKYQGVKFENMDESLGTALERMQKAMNLDENTIYAAANGLAFDAPAIKQLAGKIIGKQFDTLAVGRAYLKKGNKYSGNSDSLQSMNVEEMAKAILSQTEFARLKEKIIKSGGFHVANADTMMEQALGEKLLQMIDEQAEGIISQQKELTDIKKNNTGMASKSLTRGLSNGVRSFRTNTEGNMVYAGGINDYSVQRNHTYSYLGDFSTNGLEAQLGDEILKVGERVVKLRDEDTGDEVFLGYDTEQQIKSLLASLFTEGFDDSQKGLTSTQIVSELFNKDGGFYKAVKMFDNSKRTKLMESKYKTLQQNPELLKFVQNLASTINTTGNKLSDKERSSIMSEAGRSVGIYGNQKFNASNLSRILEEGHVQNTGVGVTGYYRDWMEKAIQPLDEAIRKRLTNDFNKIQVTDTDVKNGNNPYYSWLEQVVDAVNNFEQTNAAEFGNYYLNGNQSAWYLNNFGGNQKNEDSISKLIKDVNLQKQAIKSAEEKALVRNNSAVSGAAGHIAELKARFTAAGNTNAINQLNGKALENRLKALNVDTNVVRANGTSAIDNKYGRNADTYTLESGLTEILKELDDQQMAYALSAEGSDGLGVRIAVWDPSYTNPLEKTGAIDWNKVAKIQVDWADEKGALYKQSNGKANLLGAAVNSRGELVMQDAQTAMIKQQVALVKSKKFRDSIFGQNGKRRDYAALTAESNRRSNKVLQNAGTMSSNAVRKETDAQIGADKSAEMNKVGLSIMDINNFAKEIQEAYGVFKYTNGQTKYSWDITDQDMKDLYESLAIIQTYQGRYEDYKKSFDVPNGNLWNLLYSNEETGKNGHTFTELRQLLEQFTKAVRINFAGAKEESFGRGFAALASSRNYNPGAVFGSMSNRSIDQTANTLDKKANSPLLKMLTNENHVGMDNALTSDINYKEDKYRTYTSQKVNDLDLNNIFAQLKNIIATEGSNSKLIQSLAQGNGTAEQIRQQLLAELESFEQIRPTVYNDGLLVSKSMAESMASYRDFATNKMDINSVAGKFFSNYLGEQGTYEFDNNNLLSIKGLIAKSMPQASDNEILRRATELATSLGVDYNDIVKSITRVEDQFQVNLAHRTDAIVGTKVLTGGGGRNTINSILSDIMMNLLGTAISTQSNGQPLSASSLNNTLTSRKKLGINTQYISEDIGKKGVASKYITPIITGKLNTLLNHSLGNGKEGFDGDKVRDALKQLSDTALSKFYKYDESKKMLNFVGKRVENGQGFIGQDENGKEIAITKEELENFFNTSWTKDYQGDFAKFAQKLNIGQEDYKLLENVLSLSNNIANMVPYYNATGALSTEELREQGRVKVAYREKDALNRTFGLYLGGEKGKMLSELYGSIYEQNKTTQASKAEDKIKQIQTALNDTERLHNRTSSSITTQELTGKESGILSSYAGDNSKIIRIVAGQVDKNSLAVNEIALDDTLTSITQSLENGTANIDDYAKSMMGQVQQKVEYLRANGILGKDEDYKIVLDTTGMGDIIPTVAGNSYGNIILPHSYGRKTAGGVTLDALDVALANLATSLQNASEAALNGDLKAANSSSYAVSSYISTIYDLQGKDRHSSLVTTADERNVEHSSWLKFGSQGQIGTNGNYETTFQGLINQETQKANSVLMSAEHLKAMLTSAGSNDQSVHARNVKDLAQLYYDIMGMGNGTFSSEYGGKNSQFKTIFGNFGETQKAITDLLAGNDGTLAAEEKIIDAIIQATTLQNETFNNRQGLGKSLIGEISRYPSTQGRDKLFAGIQTSTNANLVGQYGMKVSEDIASSVNADYDGDNGVISLIYLSNLFNNERGTSEKAAQNIYGSLAEIKEVQDEVGRKIQSSLSQGWSSDYNKWFSGDGKDATRKEAFNNFIQSYYGGGIEETVAMISKRNKEYVGRFSNTATAFRNLAKNSGYDEGNLVNKNALDVGSDGNLVLTDSFKNAVGATNIRAFLESFEQDAISSKKIEQRLMKQFQGGESEAVYDKELTKLYEDINRAIMKGDAEGFGKALEYAQNSLKINLTNGRQVLNNMFAVQESLRKQIAAKTGKDYQSVIGNTDVNNQIDALMKELGYVGRNDGTNPGDDSIYRANQTIAQRGSELLSQVVQSAGGVKNYQNKMTEAAYGKYKSNLARAISFANNQKGKSAPVDSNGNPLPATRTSSGTNGSINQNGTFSFNGGTYDNPFYVVIVGETAGGALGAGGENEETKLGGMNSAMQDFMSFMKNIAENDQARNNPNYYYNNADTVDAKKGTYASIATSNVKHGYIVDQNDDGAHGLKYNNDNHSYYTASGGQQGQLITGLSSSGIGKQLWGSDFGIENKMAAAQFRENLTKAVDTFVKDGIIDESILQGNLHNNTYAQAKTGAIASIKGDLVHNANDAASRLFAQEYGKAIFDEYGVKFKGVENASIQDIRDITGKYFKEFAANLANGAYNEKLDAIQTKSGTFGSTTSEYLNQLAVMGLNPEEMKEYYKNSLIGYVNSLSQAGGAFSVVRDKAGNFTSLSEVQAYANLGDMVTSIYGSVEKVPANLQDMLSRSIAGTIDQLTSIGLMDAKTGIGHEYEPIQLEIQKMLMAANMESISGQYEGADKYIQQLFGEGGNIVRVGKDFVEVLKQGTISLEDLIRLIDAADKGKTLTKAQKETLANKMYANQVIATSRNSEGAMADFLAKKQIQESGINMNSASALSRVSYNGDLDKALSTTYEAHKNFATETLNEELSKVNSEEDELIQKQEESLRLFGKYKEEGLITQEEYNKVKAGQIKNISEFSNPIFKNDIFKPTQDQLDSYNNNSLPPILARQADLIGQRTAIADKLNNIAPTAAENTLNDYLSARNELYMKKAQGEKINEADINKVEAIINNISEFLRNIDPMIGGNIINSSMGKYNLELQSGLQNVAVNRTYAQNTESINTQAEAYQEKLEKIQLLKQDLERLNNLPEGASKERIDKIQKEINQLEQENKVIDANISKWQERNGDLDVNGKNNKGEQVITSANVAARMQAVQRYQWAKEGKLGPENLTASSIYSHVMSQNVAESNSKEWDKYFKQYQKQQKSVNKIDVQMETLKLKMQSLQKGGMGMSGVSTLNGAQTLNNYKFQLAALEKQKTNILANGLTYNKEQGTFTQNGTVLVTGTQAQREQAESTMAQLEDEKQVSIAKQNALLGNQVGLVQRIIGGVKYHLDYLMNMSLAYTIVGKIRTLFNQIVQDTASLDKNMVNMQIAANQTREEVKGMLTDFNKMATEIGTTTSEFSSAATDWLRSGYRGDVVEELSKASVYLSKLGDIQSSDATSYLISSMKGWKLEAEDAMDVVSKLVAVSNTAALSAGDLAEGMSKANNAARLAGVDMNTYIGYLTTIIDKTQKSADSVGTAMNTMFARFSNVKASKFIASQEEINSEDYNEDEWTSLNDIEKVLGGVGIKIRNSPRNWKDLQDVMDEINAAWDTWDQTTQNAVATAVAGTRQRENFLTLMSNYDDISKYAETAENSYGVAEDRMQMYSDSVEAAQQRVTNAIEKWALAFNGMGIMKDFYNTIADITNNLQLLIPVISSLLILGNFQKTMTGLVGILGNISLKATAFNKTFSTMLTNPKNFAEGLNKEFIEVKKARDANILTSANSAIYSAYGVSTENKDILAGLNKQLFEMKESEAQAVLKNAGLGNYIAKGENSAGTIASILTGSTEATAEEMENLRKSLVAQNLGIEGFNVATANATEATEEHTEAETANAEANQAEASAAEGAATATQQKAGATIGTPVVTAGTPTVSNNGGVTSTLTANQIATRQALEEAKNVTKSAQADFVAATAAREQFETGAQSYSDYYSEEYIALVQAEEEAKARLVQAEETEIAASEAAAKADEEEAAASEHSANADEHEAVQSENAANADARESSTPVISAANQAKISAGAAQLEGALTQGKGLITPRTVSQGNAGTQQGVKTSIGTGIMAMVGMAAGSSIGSGFGKNLAESLGQEDTSGLQMAGMMMGGVLGQYAVSGITSTLLSGAISFSALAGPIVVAIAGAIAFAWSENQKKIKEAKESLAKELSEDSERFNNIKTAKYDAKELDEYAKGVDGLGRNVSLTEDEYQDFIDKNNELAELFPELVVRVDEAGNKFVGFSDTASTAATNVGNVTDAIVSMTEAAQRAADTALFKETTAGGFLGFGTETVSNFKESWEAAISAYKDVVEDSAEQLYGDAENNIVIKKHEGDYNNENGVYSGSVGWLKDNSLFGYQTQNSDSQTFDRIALLNSGINPETGKAFANGAVGYIGNNMYYLDQSYLDDILEGMNNGTYQFKTDGNEYVGTHISEYKTATGELNYNYNDLAQNANYIVNATENLQAAQVDLEVATTEAGMALDEAMEDYYNGMIRRVSKYTTLSDEMQQVLLMAEKNVNKFDENGEFKDAETYQADLEKATQDALAAFSGPNAQVVLEWYFKQDLQESIDDMEANRNKLISLLQAYMISSGMTVEEGKKFMLLFGIEWDGTINGEKLDNNAVVVEGKIEGITDTNDGISQIEKAGLDSKVIGGIDKTKYTRETAAQAYEILKSLGPNEKIADSDLQTRSFTATVDTKTLTDTVDLWKQYKKIKNPTDTQIAQQKIIEQQMDKWANALGVVKGDYDAIAQKSKVVGDIDILGGSSESYDDFEERMKAYSAAIKEMNSSDFNGEFEFDTWNNLLTALQNDEEGMTAYATDMENGDKKLTNLKKYLNTIYGDTDSTMDAIARGMVEDSEGVYSALVLGDEKMIQHFKDDYGIDLTQFASFAEAKNALNELINGEMEADYDSWVNALFSKYQGDAENFAEFARAKYEANELYASLMTDFESGDNSAANAAAQLNKSSQAHMAYDDSVEEANGVGVYIGDIKEQLEGGQLSYNAASKEIYARMAKKRSDDAAKEIQDKLGTITAAATNPGDSSGSSSSYDPSSALDNFLETEKAFNEEWENILAYRKGIGEDAAQNLSEYYAKMRKFYEGYTNSEGSAVKGLIDYYASEMARQSALTEQYGIGTSSGDTAYKDYWSAVEGYYNTKVSLANLDDQEYQNAIDIIEAKREANELTENDKNLLLQKYDALVSSADTEQELYEYEKKRYDAQKEMYQDQIDNLTNARDIRDLSSAEESAILSYLQQQYVLAVQTNASKAELLSLEKSITEEKQKQAQEVVDILDAELETRDMTQADMVAKISDLWAVMATQSKYEDRLKTLKEIQEVDNAYYESQLSILEARMELKDYDEDDYELKKTILKNLMESADSEAEYLKYVKEYRQVDNDAIAKQITELENITKIRDYTESEWKTLKKLYITQVSVADTQEEWASAMESLVNWDDSHVSKLEAVLSAQLQVKDATEADWKARKKIALAAISAADTEEEYWSAVASYINLDDEHVQNQISLLELQGASNELITDAYYALLSTADTETEYFDTQSKLVAQLEKEAQLKQTILGFQKDIYDYQKKYFVGTAATNETYGDLVDAQIANSKQTAANYKTMMEARAAVIFANNNIAYDENDLDFDALSKSDKIDILLQDDTYREYFKNYIDSWEEEGSYVVDKFTAIKDDIETDLTYLDNVKPQEWTSSDQITNYVNAKVNGYQQVIEAGNEALEDSANMTDEEIQSIVDSITSATKSIQEVTLQGMQDKKTLMDNQYNALVSVIQEQIDDIEALKDASADYYDDQIDKLKDYTDDLDRTNKLLELQQKLLNATEEKKRVYREGKKICPKVTISVKGQRQLRPR